MTRKAAAVAVGFALLLAAMLALVHVRWDHEGKQFVRDGTLLAISGDEPAYIALVNSILFDHDLELGADYRRARRGGLDLGTRHRGRAVHHHTIVVDRTTNEHELWVIANDDKSQPLCDTCLDFARRTERFPLGHHLIEVPAHPPAFSVILAGAIALFNPTIETTEHYSGVVIAIASWLTIVLTYLLAHRAFRSRGPAVAVALLLVLSPWLAYSRSFFSEPMIGLFLVAGSLAMAHRKIVLAGLALFVAIALKPPFVLIAAAFIIDCALKRRWRDAQVLSAVVGALGLALAAFNFHLATTPIIAGAGGAPPLGGLRTTFDTFFDHEHGLICFVPWAPFGFMGVIDSLRRRPWLRGSALGTLFFFGMMCVVGNPPGDCYGPRYWIPFLPWLSLETVRFLLRARLPVRIVASAALGLGIVIAVSGALLYSESFMQPANRWW